MTGCFPTATGTMHTRTKAVPPPEVRLFSEYFREAGYYVTSAVLERFRTALDNWQTTYGDLGFISEDDPAQQWRPSGIQPVTAPPVVGMKDGAITARSSTAGACSGVDGGPACTRRSRGGEGRQAADGRGDRCATFGWTGLVHHL